MRFNKLFITLLLCTGGPMAYAANVTNNITGVGPQSAPVSPHFCIQNADGVMTYDLQPGQSVDGNKYSGNAYYVGGALRFGGCTTDNTYLGYLGLTVNEQHQNAISGYTAPAGIHIAYTKPAIDSNGSLTGQIQYTAINPNFNLPSPVGNNKTWPFVGINLSGLEFSKMIDPVVVPNLSQEDASGSFSDLADTKAFVNAGMNLLRVPVRWAYLQLDGPGQGDINSNYYDTYVKPLVESTTSAKIYTLVDLHSYMRYSIFGQQYAGCGPDGPCPDGTMITDAKAYQDIWSKLYNKMKSDPNINMNYVMFDLVNEPVGVPDDKVFTIQASVINTLRSQGFTGYILVEGNNWSGLHSWTTSSWPSTDGKTTYTNASLFTRDNFAKAGITDLSKIVINAHQYLDADYSGTHDSCQTDLTTTGANGFNLDAFAQYLKQNHLQAMITEFGGGKDASSCAPAIKQFVSYLQNNAAQGSDTGFIGWTIWSSGHGWGDNYNLRVKPTSYHMQALQPFLQK